LGKAGRHEMEWNKLAEEEINKYAGPSTRNLYELKRIFNSLITIIF